VTTDHLLAWDNLKTFAVNMLASKPSSKIILDSGASVLMLNDRAYFYNMIKKPIMLYLADGQKIEAEGYGDATIYTPSRPLFLGSCIFAPQLSLSLVAMATLLCVKMAVLPSNLANYFVVNNSGT
jgi:hypothetical protein